MTATDDAIDAAAGQFQSRVTVTWPGGTNPIFDLIADVSIDRSVQDQPQSVTQIAGAAAAQATITLKSGNGTYLATMLSPFSTNSWSTRTVAGYGVGQIGVVVEEGVLVSGAYSYTTLFTGTVTNFALNDDGSAVLTCIDRASTIQGSANLPAAGGIQSSTGGDTRINPLAVVDLALRAGGYYLTPTTLTGAQLSVPGIGSGIPEVGSFISAQSGTTNLASPWPTQLPTVDVAPGGSWALTSPIDTSLVGFFVSGWFYAARPGAGSTTLLVCGPISFSLSSAGTLSMSGAGGSTSTTSAGLWPAGAAAWHYMDYRLGTWHVDGTTDAPSAINASEAATLTVTATLPVLGLQVGPYASYANRSSWTPNYTAALDSVPQRLSGIARQTGAAWSLIQQIAQAYGDVAYWDGAGAFHYETRTTWAARRYVTPTYLKDDSRVISGAPSWGQDSLRRSVSASVVVPVQAQSTVLAPAFVATEIYTVPARTLLTFDIGLDYTIYDIKAAANGWQTDANSSWVRFTRADAVGDPAAALVSGVGVGFRGTSSGLQLVLSNSNSFAISVWSPGDGGSIAAGPYLIVHGKTITFPDPRTLTSQASSVGGDDLVLEDSTWRQDQVQAQAWLDSIASDVALPQVIWGSLQVPVDPRLGIGTVITMDDAPYMDVPHPVQIIGMAYDMPAEGMHTATLTIRSAYSPTGPIVGVTGRDEIGATLVLVG